MIGGVFGDTNGIAPGCELSLTYKKLRIFQYQRICLRHLAQSRKLLLQLAAN